MLPLNLAGRRIEPVNGRVLVWASSMDVVFVNQALTQSLPLFNSPADSGRFLLEASGYLSYPETAQLLVLDTLRPFRSLYVSENYQLDESPIVVSIELSRIGNSSEVIFFGFSQLRSYSYPGTATNNKPERKKYDYAWLDVYFSDGSYLDLEFAGSWPQFALEIEPDAAESHYYYMNAQQQAYFDDFYTNIYLPGFNRRDQIKVGMTLQEVNAVGLFNYDFIQPLVFSF